jgi:NAD-dependent deacetylase
MENTVKQLVDAWNDNGSALVLTGAGVSTESGLMDFTGEGALFGGVSTHKILSRDFFESERAIFWKYCRERLYSSTVLPNLAHQTLAEWEETGLVSGIITQNIDGLHQIAGSVNVVELHGNMLTVVCDGCGKQALVEAFYTSTLTKGICIQCKSAIRPKIILYGEKLDAVVMAAAEKMIDNATMLVVIGTRVKTTAPFDLINRFKARVNSTLAYIGKPPPDMAGFDIVLEGKIGDIITELRNFLF